MRRVLIGLLFLCLSALPFKEVAKGFSHGNFVAAAGCTITGVSNSTGTTPTFDNTASNAAVGTASATTTGTCGAITWSVSDTTHFIMNSSTGAWTSNGVVTACNAGCTTNLTATISGATGSPFSLSVTATGVAPGTGTLVAVRNLKNWGSNATPTGFYQEVEQCFAKNAVPTGSIAEPRKGDGTTVMTNWQADNRIMWGTTPTDSLRCARFTFKYPSQLAASGTDTLKFYSKTGAWNNTGWTTACTTGGTTCAVITAQDFKMQIVISGVTYTLGVNNEIGRGNTYAFDVGPTAIGVRIHGVFRNGTGSSSTDQGALHGSIYVVAYENGDFKVWGRADSCRASNATCSAVTVTSAALLNGASSLWTWGGGSFWGGTYFVTADTDGQPYYSGTDNCAVANSCVRQVVAGFPVPVLANSYTTNLWDAKVTPFFQVAATGNIATVVAAMNGAPNSITYTPMGYGDYVGAVWGAAGASNWIGWFPASSGIAMWKQDWTSLRQDAIDALVEGAQQWHFRDSTNGNLLNLNGAATYSGTTQNSTIGWCSGATITISGGNSQTQDCDPTHIPSFAQYQLIYSGEEWWLDQQQDETTGLVGARAGNGACYSRNPLYNSQWYATTSLGSGLAMRGQAWGGREIDNAAWLTPSAHPMYQYFQDEVAQNWGAASDYITSPSGGCSSGSGPLWAFDANWDTLGLMPDLYSQDNGPGLTAGFTNDYWGMVVNMGILRGQISSSAKIVTSHLTKFVLGRAINGCAWASDAEYINISNGNQVSGSLTSFATTWSQVYTGIGNGNTGVINTPTQGGPYTNALGTNCPASGMADNQAASFNTFDSTNAAYATLLYNDLILGTVNGITGASTVRDRLKTDRTAKCGDEFCPATFQEQQPQWGLAIPQ